MQLVAHQHVAQHQVCEHLIVSLNRITNRYTLSRTSISQILLCNVELCFLGVNVAETVKVLTELKHTPASPNSARRMSTQSLQLQPQPPQPVLSSFQSPSNAIYGTIKQGQSNTIYAQPSQLIQGSPSAIRRATGNRSQSAERKTGESKLNIMA